MLVKFPRWKKMTLLNDLVDRACIGEEIEVTRIYTNNLDSSLNMKIGSPVFSPVFEANYDLSSAYKLSEEDMAEIKKLAEDNRIDKRLSCVLNQICRL
ncbi:DNA replication licensing factor MCM2 [Cinnamomum micranthum f. kanehirae]|uniref:DNA replication licensing factor MCM2 n=1 Tax=Cinnamomum micranthum f. kanehirae TaxID=337451 RepID=A0A443P2M0_9MAGN|nr:DNA replication licensing factor MCM2 [Cinnamomum micranthum f. kanehirae]